MKNLCLLFIFVALAACGGGDNSPTASFSALSVLGNGDGIARGVASNGNEALLYSPQIAVVVQSANEAQSNAMTDVNASDFPVTSVNGFARTRSGTLSSDGIVFNVTAVEDTRVTNAGMIFFELPSGNNDISMVTGDPYSNTPTGSHTYSGLQTTTASNAIAPGATGSFNMTADFSNKTFAYVGSSAGVAVTGSGVLDVSNGRYATSDLSVTSGGAAYGGTMHGLLHGSGATSTTGIFHTSGSSPAYTGAFVGGR
tara:strand:- start:414 stop:1178 length:765 start_codon:yes stop_codon:yes gene_type:complete